jgi:hypothetical protein
VLEVDATVDDVDDENAGRDGTESRTAMLRSPGGIERTEHDDIVESRKSSARENNNAENTHNWTSVVAT